MINCSYVKLYVTLCVTHTYVSRPICICKDNSAYKLFLHSYGHQKAREYLVLHMYIRRNVFLENSPT